MLQSLTVRQGRRMSGTFQKPGVPTNHLVPKKGIPQPIIISVLDLSGFTDTTGIVNDSKVDTIVGGGQKWINDPATVSRGETFSQEGANIKHCSDRTRKRRLRTSPDRLGSLTRKQDGRMLQCPCRANRAIVVPRSTYLPREPTRYLSPLNL